MTRIGIPITNKPNMATDERRIPQSVIKRLTAYLTRVQILRASNVKWVSSQEMAKALDLTSSTVRQDLSHLDYYGIAKRGYETVRLEASISAVLGADKVWNIMVIGAGNLGRALVKHEEFGKRGFHIRAILDSDARKVGKRVGVLKIESTGNLARIVRRERIDMAIIAVPAGAAQDTADILIKTGVKGILNMTLAHIIVPNDIIVVEMRIVSSLRELSYRMLLNTSK
ncbi:MAG: redox-sensing transcriptional repressor Rex [Lentisphaerae bacterium]|nr:redox-sensing transcriptional repressor Rex [Lentisphaerota bacterium]